MPRADSARADEGTAADRTPCRKIVMPRFSRPPRVLFRTLFSASVKEAAICPAPHQPWCEDMMGVHASLLRGRSAAAPSRLSRCARAQPSAESHGWSTGSTRQQQQRQGLRHVGCTGEYDLSGPKHPLVPVSTF